MQPVCPSTWEPPGPPEAMAQLLQDTRSCWLSHWLKVMQNKAKQTLGVRTPHPHAQIKEQRSFLLHSAGHCVGGPRPRGADSIWDRQPHHFHCAVRKCPRPDAGQGDAFEDTDALTSVTLFLRQVPVDLSNVSLWKQGECELWVTRNRKYAA